MCFKDFHSEVVKQNVHFFFEKSDVLKVVSFGFLGTASEIFKKKQIQSIAVSGSLSRW